jgi:hypothetical protein
MPDPAETAARTMALAAGIAPGVMRSLIDNRDRIIAAALQAPRSPNQAIPNLLSPALDGLGERTVRMTCLLAADERIFSGLRSAMSRAAPAVPVDDLLGPIQELIVDPLFAVLGVPDARMRGALITAHLSGMVATRYVVGLEPLASATDDEIAAWFGPIIQRLIDPTVPLSEQ